MEIVCCLDSVKPTGIYNWFPITGSTQHDGYPSVRDGYLMESLLRHLFCKKLFCESTGMSIDSFIIFINSHKHKHNFMSSAAIIIQLLGPACAPFLNAVGYKVIDSALKRGARALVYANLCMFIKQDIQNKIVYQFGETATFPDKTEMEGTVQHMDIFMCAKMGKPCKYAVYFDILYDAAPSRVRRMHNSQCEIMCFEPPLPDVEKCSINIDKLKSTLSVLF